MFYQKIVFTFFNFNIFMFNSMFYGLNFNEIY